MVWSAWTEREHLEAWWGPTGSRTLRATLDLRHGGAYHFGLVEADGSTVWSKLVFTEIAAPERLIFVQSFTDEQGNVVRAPFSEHWPLEVETTVTLTEQEGRTAVALTARPLDASDAERATFVALFDSLHEGYGGTLDRLAERLATLAPGDPEGAVVIERIFDFPRELVWRAWTEPEHVMRWWGPANFTSPACRIDLRVGGKYVFCMRTPEGQDLWSTGTYREIVPLERLVATDSFADEHGNPVPASHYGMTGDFPPETTVTVTFEDLGGRTRLTLRHAGLPVGWRGMTGAGWGESLDKLAESLRTA